MVLFQCTCTPRAEAKLQGLYVKEPKTIIPSLTNIYASITSSPTHNNVAHLNHINQVSLNLYEQKTSKILFLLTAVVSGNTAAEDPVLAVLF